MAARRNGSARPAPRRAALQRSRSRQAHPSGPRLRDRDDAGRSARTGGRGGLCRRADSLLFAGARRPAGDGRRRPASRPADLSQGIRRSDGDPGRRLAAGAGVSPAGVASGPAVGCRGPRAHHRYARRRERHRRHGRWPGARPRRRRRLAHRGRSRALARAQDRSAHPRERADGRALQVGTRRRASLRR